jgi:hypothetical protein
MRLTTKAYMNDYAFRCKITDASGEVVYTRIVVLHLVDQLSMKGLVSHSTLTAIADAIRVKTETSAKMLPGDMAAMIESIGGIPDGVTELEVAICAPPGLITLPVPCSMSATPTCVVA